MRQMVDRYLNKVPMYPVVGIALGILIGTALVLSTFGQLSFSPIALIACLITFLGASVAASLGFSKLYGVQPHLPSAAITALILTLVFTPSLQTVTILQFAFIAVVAQASKYVITYRRRHIVNPAAFGALIGGVLQLQFASWWVGTPALLVPLCVAALIVIYKTREMLLAGTYLATCLILLFMTGVPIWIAVASYPVIFLAGFMLSEPLTLPPFAWQKIVVAVAVGVLTALPFHVGSFYSSPELALIIGNLVAFGLAFKYRTGLSLRLRARHSLTPNITEFEFESPTSVHVVAGQYIELTLPHAKPDIRGLRRMFSLTSKPNESVLTIAVKFSDQGSSFKRQLEQLKVGSKIHTTGIRGDFTLPTSADDKLLFIAGGIGITPFISHLRSLTSPRDIVLLYFVRSPQDTAYKDFLDASNITVHYFYQDGSDTEASKTSLDDTILQTYVTDVRKRTAYVSGAPAMVDSTKTVLRGKVRRVRTDYFTGY